ncbi:hypothetical protein [Streptomyces broussonetiae]|nr:hypothetical protein [Streptomyces broussonetiae]
MTALGLAVAGVVVGVLLGRVPARRGERAAPPHLRRWGRYE